MRNPFSQGGMPVRISLIITLLAIRWALNATDQMKRPLNFSEIKEMWITTSKIGSRKLT